jgi:hypothetical protein
MLAVFTKGFFSLIKKGAGGKLVGSNVFGRAEYYLGMVGGSIRFLCILLAGLALLNARLYTQQDIAADTAFQNDVYGSTYFPGLSTLQINVFKESMIGSLVKKQASFLLITPTKPENKGIEKRKDDLP